MPNLAGGNRPKYQVTISDGVSTVGIMSHTADTPSVRAIRRLPRGPGVERKQIVQSSFSGGRGGFRFATDTTRIADAGAAWTMVDGYWISGPLPHVCEGTILHRVVADQPGSLSGSYPASPPGTLWQPLVGGYARQARKLTFTPAMAINYVAVYVRKVGNPGALSLSLANDAAGVPGTVVGTATITAGNGYTVDQLGQWVVANLVATYGGATVGWILVQDLSAPSASATDYWELAVHAVVDASQCWLWNGATWALAASYPFFYRLDDSGYMGRFQAHFFEYKRQLYMVTQPDDGSAAKLYMNGYRGVASGGGQTLSTMKDSHQAWPTNSLGNVTVLITSGPLKGRRAVSTMGHTNTATSVSIYPAWPSAPVDNSTEYVILGSDVWTEITGTGLTAPVTDVKVLNGIVYFAQGSTVNIRRMQAFNSAGTWTTQWADDASNRADYLATWVDDTGKMKMYRGKNDDVTFSRADFQAWGVNLTFDASVPAGNQESNITAMAVYNDTLHVGKEDGMGLVKNYLWSEVPIAMAAGRDGDNGTNLVGWNTNLYFPFLDGFERLYGQVIDDIGPNRGEGMPVLRRGKIADFKPVLQYGYAALNGGVLNQSAILATTSPGGDWHELYRGPFDSVLGGRGIRNLFYQSVPNGPNRLWFVEGADISYLNMPHDTHTPLNDSPQTGGNAGMLYAGETTITTTWFDADTGDLDHFWAQLRVFSRSLGVVPAPGTGLPVSGQWIEVDYQVDNDTAWTTFPSVVSASPHQMLAVGNGTVTGRRIRFRLRGYTSDPTLPIIVNSLDLRLDIMHEVLYDFILDFQLKDRLMLISGGDSRTHSLKAALATLAGWQENAVLLTWRCVIPQFDNLRGHIDPVSLVPRSWQTNNVELAGSLTFKQDS